jgi:hypothetical protein
VSVSVSIVCVKCELTAQRLMMNKSVDRSNDARSSKCLMLKPALHRSSTTQLTQSLRCYLEKSIE